MWTRVGDLTFWSWLLPIRTPARAAAALLRAPNPDIALNLNGAGETSRRRDILAFAAIGLLATPAFARSAAPNAGLDLTPYRGRVVYLDFWASWCGPCKLSFPFMERMTSSFARKDLAVIAVNVDHAKDKADAFLADVGSALPVIYDPKGQIATEFHVQAMPTSVLIDRNGRVRFTHEGFFVDKIQTYQDHIVELIDEH
jgi:thiol-disulfide isomerase/thioredoxin